MPQNSTAAGDADFARGVGTVVESRREFLESPRGIDPGFFRGDRRWRLGHRCWNSQMASLAPASNGECQAGSEIDLVAGAPRPKEQGCVSLPLIRSGRPGSLHSLTNAEMYNIPG
jgi:hypothetical protein